MKENQIMSSDQQAPVAPGYNERPWISPGPPPWGSIYQDIGHEPPTKRVPVWVWVFLAVVAVVLTFGLIGALAGGKGEPGPGFTTMPVQGGTAPVAEQSAETYKVGKTFRSGEFQYTVHGVKRGIAQVGDQFSRTKAQGSFTRLDITVKNMTKEPVYFDTDNRVKVEDATGSEFSSDSNANIFGNNGEDGWLTEINPGNSIRAYAFFDLPADVKATRVVVSAGMLTFEADAIVPLS